MTAPLTIEQIERLEQLEREATPGPWHQGASEECVESETHGSVAVCMQQGESPFVKHGKYQEEYDAILIAAMRNALPQLLELARIGLNQVDESERGFVSGVNPDYIAQVETDRDRLLAALKAEAIRKAGYVFDMYPDWPSLTCEVCAITFRVTRNEAGELVAEEVTE